MKKNLLFFLILSKSIYASYTSMQGYSGFINIPTANVAPLGSMDFVYSNNVDIAKNIDKNKRDKLKASNYFLNIGILPYIEIGGRISEIPGAMRDLSANFKIQLPTDIFLPDYFPKIAIGAQDFGGVTGHYKSYYTVLSGEYKKLEYAIGYGFKSKRLNGIFGGISYSVNNYLDLIAEYDSKEKYIGLRVNSGNYFSFGKLFFLFSKNLDRKKKPYSFALNYRAFLEKSDIKDSFKIINSKKSALENIKATLINLGYENIDIGQKQDKIYIAYENSIFLRDDTDSVKNIIEIVSYFKKYKFLDLTLKKSNVKLKHIVYDLNNHNTIKIDTSYPSVQNYSYHNINSNQFKLKLQIAPDLTSFVATEYGLYDYLLSLKFTATVNLYKGLDFSATYITPIMKSDDLDPKKGAYAYAYKGSRLDSAMFHHTLSYKNFVNHFSFGIFRKDYYGYMNELSYFFADNRIKYKYAYFKNRDKNFKYDERKISIFSFEHYFSKLDFSLTASYGKFWNQDIGYEIKFKKYLGDSTVYLFYQDSKNNNINRGYGEKRNRYIGIGIEIPLTPKRVKNSKYAQISTSKSFSQQIRSTIKRKDGSNKLVVSEVDNPKSNYDFDINYLNRSRFFDSYFKKHIK